MRGRPAAWARLGAVLGVVVAVDQATKAYAVSRLGLGQSIDVFFGIDVTHVRNTGVAFGALSNGGLLIYILVGAAIVALLGYFAVKASTPGLWAPVGLLLGGAVGNLLDRAREGTVIDFIDPIAWPAFNLADVCVVVGVLGLFYVSGGDASRDRRSGAAAGSEAPEGPR